MAVEIPLSRGAVALVSECDFERVGQFKWSLDQNGYAVRMIQIARTGGIRQRRKVLLHRFLLDAPGGMEVDHINHDKLDNRRDNIRLVSRTLNRANAGPKTTSSHGYKGVAFHSRDTKWRASIAPNGIRRGLGTFGTPEEAARAYDIAALQAWGDFAYLNFPEHRTTYLQALNRSIFVATKST